MDAQYPIPNEPIPSDWLEPSAALALVRERFNTGLESGIRWIAERLRSGHIVAVAGSFKSLSEQARVRVLMTPDAWKNWACLAPGVMDFWDTGDVTLHGRTGAEIGRFFDVRFDPTCFPELPPKGPQQPAPADTLPPPAKNRGGRPRKEYWEDAITAIFTLLYEGDFKPKNQAEIEGKMADWITAQHNDHPSEAAIRIRAAKIWNTHKE